MRANEICASGKSPLDVMYETLMFWHRDATALAENLEKLIVSEDNPEQRRDRLATALRASGRYAPAIS